MTQPRHHRHEQARALLVERGPASRLAASRLPHRGRWPRRRWSRQVDIEGHERSLSSPTGLLGSANRMYDSGNAYCQVVIPNPLHDGGELFPGSSHQGNACLQAPVAEVEDGSLGLAVTPTFSFDGPVFVATR